MNNYFTNSLNKDNCFLLWKMEKKSYTLKLKPWGYFLFNSTQTLDKVR